MKCNYENHYDSIFNHGFCLVCESEEKEYKMTFKELQEKENFDDRDTAKFFNLNYMSYMNSTAKKRYQDTLLRFYEYIKNT